MARKRRFLFFLFVCLLTLPAGALGYQYYLDVTHDHCTCPGAERVLHEHAEGRGSAYVHFDVPRGVEELRVAALYDLDGRASIRLQGPGTDASETLRGDNVIKNNAWKVIDAPRSGTWKIDVNYDAEGSMTFAVYW